MQNTIISFIGGGNMATSLITGLIDSGFDKQKIWVSDPNSDKRERFKSELHIHVAESNAVAAEKGDVLVLAIKPQDIKNVARDIKEITDKKMPLIISVAGAITTVQLNRWFGAELPIVRAMPNTPALLRAGATALYANGKVSEEQKNLAESILRAVGVIVWVAHEREMEIVSALSGSGPAYFFYIMEALQDAALELGLSKDAAKILTLQTALGASRMALESELPLDLLIKRVASPGGTTEKGLESLEKDGMINILKKALKATKERGEEISHHFDAG